MMNAQSSGNRIDNEKLKKNVTATNTWLRLVYMLIYGFFFYVAIPVMAVVALVQFVFQLVAGNDNGKIRQFGHSLSQYMYQVLMFLSFNSEEKPFPFSDWPQAPTPMQDDAAQASSDNDASQNTHSADHNASAPAMAAAASAASTEAEADTAYVSYPNGNEPLSENGDVSAAPEAPLSEEDSGKHGDQWQNDEGGLGEYTPSEGSQSSRSFGADGAEDIPPPDQNRH